jgi:hypothetical protein
MNTLLADGSGHPCFYLLRCLKIFIWEPVSQRAKTGHRSHKRIGHRYFPTLWKVLEAARICFVVLVGTKSGTLVSDKVNLVGAQNGSYALMHVMQSADRAGNVDMIR